MSDSRPGEPALSFPAEALPRKPVFLATSPKRTPPVPQYLVVEDAERSNVAGHSVVLVVPLQDRDHPLPLLRQFLMAASL